MLCSVASPGTGNWVTCLYRVCECTQILQPFKLCLCLFFCRVSSKLYRQSHQSPEINCYLILPEGNISTTYIKVSLIFWDKNVGIASLSKSQYRGKILGDVTGFVEALQYWFRNNGLLLNPRKSAIVYFGTHGRLRQSILPS